MINDSEKHAGLVRRITIDEKLGDELIRVLIADLKDNVETFSDDPSFWEDEEDDLVHPEDYQKIIGMTRENAQRWPWASLYEGQVFLIGKFRVYRDWGVKTVFIVDLKRRNFRHNDRSAKELVKRKYLTVLERSTSDGETGETNQSD